METWYVEVLTPGSKDTVREFVNSISHSRMEAYMLSKKLLIYWRGGTDIPPFKIPDWVLPITYTLTVDEVTNPETMHQYLTGCSNTLKWWPAIEGHPVMQQEDAWEVEEAIMFSDLTLYDIEEVEDAA